MVYYEPAQPELYQGRNLDPTYHRFAHRQRIELVHAYDEAHGRGEPGPLRRERLHRARPATRAPARASATRSSPARSTGRARRSSSGRAPGSAPTRGWRSSRGRLPKALTFLYLPDEPYPAQYPEVRRLAENVHSNPGPGGRLPIFVTKRPVPELEGLIDIWSVPPQALDLEAAAAERARGRRVSIYNGGRPQGPTPVIDAPATEARAIAWASFKHDLDLYFFWHGDPLAAQPPEAGRAEAERVGQPDHVRQPRPAEQARRGPGLHQRRRRPDVPGRGEASIPRRIAASPGPCRPCSSRTCAAACRTTCT